MLNDDSARVPFAVIGILLIFISTFTGAYLLKMESAGVSSAIEDEREGELNDALAFAEADIDNALNMACMYAEDEAGRSPIVNVTNGSADDVEMDWFKRMALRNFSRYLAANYLGGLEYGDYVVAASVDGPIGVTPLDMNLTRTVYHPVLQCNRTYGAYYVASVPLRLRITRPGSSLDHTEPYTARTLVTSRYPLLKELTGEYEARLNGTVMLTDVTAASFAYTWARGYCQYFSGDPANIVDNGDLELIANAASLLEQGCVFNSVDPVSLAALVKHTYDSSRPTKDIVEHNSLSNINQYNLTNNSRRGLPNNLTPGEYRFDADAIVDKELRYAIADPVSRYYVDSAYWCRMHMAVSRRPVSERYNDTGSICKESHPLTPNENGTGPFFREIWKVWTNNSEGGGWTEVVTIDYVMEELSPLDDPNDVMAPYREAGLTLGDRTYVDSNLLKAVDGYNEQVPAQGVLFNRIKFPDGYSGYTREFACRHNEWVESASVSELKSLASTIKEDVSVTLKASDYGAYDEMMDAAYDRMLTQFTEHYFEYLAESDYRDNGMFYTCGAEYVFYKRRSFLNCIDGALNASRNASDEVDRKVDESLKEHPGMNSSTLKDSARTSAGLLDNTKMFIPFGLNMTLAGGEGKDDPYKWEEDVAVAVDQRPNFLGVDEYVDPETGYTVRPLKVRNVCVFALPTDLVGSGRATEAVLDGIDAVSSTAYRLANDTVTAETSRLVENVSDQAKQAIKDQINDALVHDQDLQGQVTRDDVEASVNGAFDNRTPEEVVGDMKNGTLQREIAGDLAQKAKRQAERELAKKADKYVDTYGDYIETKAEEAILGAEEKAISYVVNALSDGVKQVFEDYMAAAVEKAGDAAIGAALKRIPMGLPLLPPWGWWATMNLWYIEINGEIPYLAVYDTDNEPVPDPILGQRATVYIRRPAVIRDGEEILGRNEPVRFQQRTATFIIVPPGEQGIGDKLGGWEEKSPGFDEEAA